ncbi:MAG: hypothetical protein ACFFKA_00665 [Candidatus Thorarchaeota archaeon]
MYSVSTKEYGKLLQRCWDVRSPLYVYGGPGIGKSEIPRQIFEVIAKSKSLKFVEWTDLTLEGKMDCIKNAEKYFVFCDQRVGQMDSTDLRGIPNMINTEMLETIPMSWVIYFTQANANGVIFFDELNLAAPVVAGQAYQIINDRTIADRRLGDNVFVFGAGNRAIDQAHVFEMPFPLRDRFNEVEIYPSKQEWVEWAAGKVNPHLIAFINWKESYLYNVVSAKNQKSSTPRGITRASKLIGDEDIISDTVHQFVSIAVGEAFASEFQAYCKHYKSLSWDKIYKNPSTVKEFEVDRLWAVIGGMAEQYSHSVEDKRFNQMMDVINVMHADFGIVGLRMIKETDFKRFKMQIRKYPNFKQIVEEKGKYILD